MESVFFSIVVPVHNKGPHISRSISSIINQDFDNFELIVVNDASTDNSLSEIEKFSDDRIRLYHRDVPGPGGYEARNLGISHAKGEWVAFLDADDEWVPGYLENVVKAIDRCPSADFISSGWLVKDGDRALESSFFSKNKGVETEIVLDLNDYLEVHANGLDVVNTNVAVLRRSLLESVGGFPKPAQNCKRAGDGQTWLRAMLSGATMVWLPIISAIYYQDTVNMVSKQKLYDIEENGLLSYLKDSIKSGGHSEEVRLLLARYYRSRASSSLFQYARRGGVTWSILKKSILECGVNRRVLVIMLAYFFPKTVARLLSLSG